MISSISKVLVELYIRLKMAANKSGICKVETCNKLQVRDGFCKQCGDYHLQKQIMTKLGEVSDELAQIKTVGNGSQTAVTNNAPDNTMILVDIMSKQTELLQGVVTGLADLKQSINKTPQTQVTERVIEKVVEPKPERKRHIEMDADSVFVPSLDTINTSGEVQIVEDTHNETSKAKDLSSIAEKLNKMNM